MKWIATYCAEAQFILKVDDDILVNTFFLLRHLKSLVDHRDIDAKSIMCHVNKKMRVIRRKSSKWYVSRKEYPNEYYFKYCSGSGKTKAINQSVNQNSSNSH